MTVYFVTSKLGSGKTLAAVGQMCDYRVQNRRVAGNTEGVIVSVVGFSD